MEDMGFDSCVIFSTSPSDKLALWKLESWVKNPEYIFQSIYSLFFSIFENFKWFNYSLIAFLICPQDQGRNSFNRYVFFLITYIRLHVSWKHVLLIFGGIAKAHNRIEQSIHGEDCAAAVLYCFKEKVRKTAVEISWYGKLSLNLSETFKLFVPWLMPYWSHLIHR